MDLKWHITAKDVAHVRSFMKSAQGSPFVQERWRRNVLQQRPAITRSACWRVLVGCTLTTQQRSGPASPVSLLMKRRPFPLSYRACAAAVPRQRYIRSTLSTFGGIRRAPTISGQLARNFRALEEGLWARLLAETARVASHDGAAVEREVAHFIAESLHGFGPKQSRNYLQWLGVSRYEIPIDSRITKWLNGGLLSFKLDAQMLSNTAYYDFVSDGIIALCHRAGVLPCMLDAAVFSSFDKAGWTDADSRF